MELLFYSNWQEIYFIRTNFIFQAKCVLMHMVSFWANFSLSVLNLLVLLCGFLLYPALHIPLSTDCLWQSEGGLLGVRTGSVEQKRAGHSFTACNVYMYMIEQLNILIWNRSISTDQYCVETVEKAINFLVLHWCAWFCWCSYSR